MNRQITNMKTKDIIKDALRDFDGTLILVSLTGISLTD
jgi:hypothetical protein